MLTEVQQALCRAPDNLSAEVTAFIDNMADAYRWADLVICRAGALTVSEVACAGVAAMFVPLPSAIDDHQTANANWLVEQGAALLWPQRDLNNKNLVSLLQGWQQDRIAPCYTWHIRHVLVPSTMRLNKSLQFCRLVIGVEIT